MFGNITLNVRSLPHHKPVEVKVKKSDLISVVEQKIISAGVVAHGVKLFFNSQEIPENKTVEEAGLTDGSIIDLLAKNLNDQVV